MGFINTTTLLRSVTIAIALLTTATASPSASSKFILIQKSGNATLVYAACDGPGLRACKDLLPELETVITARVKSHVDGYYAGKILNPSPDPSQNFDDVKYLADSKGIMQVPVCNLLDGLHGSTPDSESRNFLQQKCGGDNDSKCSFTCAKSNGLISCQIGNAADCQSERAWIRGARLYLLNQKQTEVLAEFKAGKSFKLSDNCVPLPSDPAYKDAFDYANQAIADWSATNQNKAVSCDPTTSATDNPILSAGCFLNSSRQALERVAAQAAVCEIFARTEKSWEQKKLEYQNLPEILSNEIATSSDCKSQWNDAVAFQKCLNDQYKAKIVQKIKTVMGAANVSTPIQ